MSPLLSVLLAVAVSASAAAAESAPRDTFSVRYTVEILGPKHDRARVQWELAGIDELERIRLRAPEERFRGFTASGTLAHRPGEVLWRPNGPYGRLAYEVALDHRRRADRGFDSYAGGDWVITRTSDLFPRASVLYRHDVEPQPESRTTLVFQLPAGWDAVTVMPEIAPRTFAVESPRLRFDHPRGWLMLGRFRRSDVQVGGTHLTVAAAPGVYTPSVRLTALLERALPILESLLLRTPLRLLVVRGPDPMWRGGLSGEESLYLHGRRRLRSGDGSSPWLHELFHVLAPFRPAPDAHWVTEGLAEYYSVEIQRRTGDLDQASYERSMRLFAQQGVWDRDFTSTPAPRLHNNSAPYLMLALDERIRAATDGARSLDDVVADLARSGGRVSTAQFLGAARRVAGRGFGAFFRRHVYRGERPVTRTTGRHADARGSGDAG